MPTTKILAKPAMALLEREMAKLEANSKLLKEFKPLLERSKLFHLKLDIARARRAATVALAGNEISQETWVEIQKSLDKILFELPSKDKTL
jgi:hypothetical protein